MTLTSKLNSLVTAIAASVKGVKTLVNGNVADNSALTTIVKTNLVAAINEVNAKSQIAIDDGTTATSSVWSSSKTSASISSGIASVVAAAPAAFDTLIEIATELQSNQTASTSMLAAINNRLRFDAAQSLTAPQQTQALANIGGQDAASIAWTEVDLAAAFTAALV
jgi:hypothetical protein